MRCARRCRMRTSRDAKRSPAAPGPTTWIRHASYGDDARRCRRPMTISQNPARGAIGSAPRHARLRVTLLFLRRRRAASATAALASDIIAILYIALYYSISSYSDQCTVPVVASASRSATGTAVGGGVIVRGACETERRWACRRTRAPAGTAPRGTACSSGRIASGRCRR